MVRATLANGGSGRLRDLRDQVVLQLEEFTRRNRSALGMDALYLIGTSFFTVLATQAWFPQEISLPFVGIAIGVIPFSWPLLIAVLPLGGLLYFGYRSSMPFFISQLIVVVITVVVARAGWLPL